MHLKIFLSLSFFFDYLCLSWYFLSIFPFYYFSLTHFFWFSLSLSYLILSFSLFDSFSLSLLWIITCLSSLWHSLSLFFHSFSIPLLWFYFNFSLILSSLNLSLSLSNCFDSVLSLLFLSLSSLIPSLFVFGSLSLSSLNSFSLFLLLLFHTLFSASFSLFVDSFSFPLILSLALLLLFYTLSSLLLSLSLLILSPSLSVRDTISQTPTNYLLFIFPSAGNINIIRKQASLLKDRKMQLGKKMWCQFAREKKKWLECSERTRNQKQTIKKSKNSLKDNGRSCDRRKKSEQQVAEKESV